MTPYYQDSSVTIYHGDCREILPNLGRVAAIVTDPPYGGGLAVDFAERFKTKAGKWWKNSDRSTQARHVPIIGDDIPFNPTILLEHQAKALVLWGANWYSSRLPDSGGWWVWDKRNGSRDVSEADWPMSEAELAYTNVGKGVRIFRYTWFGLIRDGEHGEHHHPTQKPIALMRWCIEGTKTDGVILDPFMGSGTTLRAAKDLGRKAIGIEIEERYCEIAARRLSQEVLPLCESVKPAERSSEPSLLDIRIVRPANS